MKLTRAHFACLLAFMAVIAINAVVAMNSSQPAQMQEVAFASALR